MKKVQFIFLIIGLLSWVIAAITGPDFQTAAARNNAHSGGDINLLYSALIILGWLTVFPIVMAFVKMKK